jgi:hypothetical protein
MITLEVAGVKMLLVLGSSCLVVQDQFEPHDLEKGIQSQKSAI